jgi:rubrerythrin
MMDLKSYEDIINFAISREEAAIEAYGDMSEKAKTPGLKELLLDLQNEEKNHKKLLEDITTEQIASFKTEEVIDLKISDYLTKEPPSEDMTFQDLLILAAKKEQEAVELYTRLGEGSDNEDLKKLFDFLIAQEKAHKLKVETEYEKHVLEDD